VKGEVSLFSKLLVICTLIAYLIYIFISDNMTNIVSAFEEMKYSSKIIWMLQGTESFVHSHDTWFSRCRIAIDVVVADVASVIELSQDDAKV